MRRKEEGKGGGDKVCLKELFTVFCSICLVDLR